MEKDKDYLLNAMKESEEIEAFCLYGSGKEVEEMARGAGKRD